MFKARPTGIDVNKDITSNETITSSTAMVRSLMRSLESALLRTVYFFLTNGDRITTLALKCLL